MRPRCLLPLLLSLAVWPGCAKFSRTTSVAPIQPPGGTGKLQIDFRGDWTVTEARLSGIQSAGEGDPGPMAGGITLPGVGSVVQFDALGFVSVSRQEMRRERLTLDGSLQVTQYLNQVDGRVALYILKIEPRPALGGEQFDQVQLAFGTQDQNHLLGVVSFHLGPTGGQPARTGAFEVRLQRR